MSMSLPMIIQPCRERNVHGMVHEENLTSLTSQQRHAMRGQLYKLVNQQRVAQGRSSIVRNGSHDQNSGSTAEAPGVSERGEDGECGDAFERACFRRLRISISICCQF